MVRIIAMVGTLLYPTVEIISTIYNIITIGGRSYARVCTNVIPTVRRRPSMWRMRQTRCSGLSEARTTLTHRSYIQI